MNRQASSGGAATASGMDFQHRVAAWVAVQVLAEKAATLPWDLPSATALERIECETKQPVDDLLIVTSDNGFVFCQIKHRLTLSSRASSDFASALNQFVCQFIYSRNMTGRRSTIRPLDPAKDRLVLITSLVSSKLIRVLLPNLLKKLRNLSPGQTLNDQERRALSIVRKHISRSWRKTLKAKPSKEELHQLLSLIHIHVMDVEAEGRDERDAKNLLRMAVLRKPEEADKAWNTLVTLCAGYTSQRSGAGRAILQRELLKVGCDLKAPRSYEEDIEKLRNRSFQTLAALAHLAEIRVGSRIVKVRRACTQALCQAAEDGSILVIGEPGVGKSGVLHDFVEELSDNNRDYIFLAIDRLAAKSLGELREELGLEHELSEIIENWPGLQPAFLVIDTLDAARWDSVGKMIRDLIRQAIEKKERWRVVVSIRKFDLRYGTEIQQLFAGTPPTEFADPEFKGVRHLNVPRFSQEELAQIGAESPSLQEIITNATSELRELLLLPFNLRLMAELIGEGIASGQLTPIKTQIGLLDKYWEHRVLRNDGYDDGREAILREMIERMVEYRTLRADRSAVARPDTSELLKDLLSTQVLIEWQASPEAKPDRYSLAFSHHVIFDYAVARLLFRGTDDKVIRRLSGDPELVIVVRPSLFFHFYYIWESNANADRSVFWDLTFRLIDNPRIPEVGKIIGPAVPAELARSMSDLEPFCIALEKHDKVAEDAFRHLIRTLLATAPENLAGSDAGPWFQLLERVSRNLRQSVAYDVLSLLITLCERPEALTPEQLVSAGNTARRLLEFAWSQSLRDSYLVVHALQCVCRTFESDPKMSAALIRRCLEPAHLTRFGFEEMPWLAHEVKRLIRADTKLVADIYRAAFGYEEKSEEPAQIGRSRILTLVSNRRQNYQMAWYELAEVFPKFLESAPEEATRVLVRIVESYVAQRHPQTTSEPKVFSFGDQSARLLADYSAWWDEGNIYRYNEPLKMIDSFQRFLEGLATRQDNEDKIRALIKILVSENQLAVFWRRLLLAGARFPKSIGQEILPLAYATPILICSETTVPAGEYLKAIFPILGTDERQKIERTIFSIPDVSPPNLRETAERIRDRLLGCLPLEMLVTEDARQRLEELHAQNAIPPNESLIHFEVSITPYGQDEYLREQGVPIESEANQQIQRLERPVKQFADKHLNLTPRFEEAIAILPVLCALYEALERADVDGVHPMKRDFAWETLTAACARIVKTPGFSCNSEIGRFVANILLKAYRHPEPVYNHNYDSRYDGYSLRNPEVRIYAAEGLIIMARHNDCATDEVLKAIKELSIDPVPAVRAQITYRLNNLYYTAPQLMWSIIDHVVKSEENLQILREFITFTIKSLNRVQPDHVFQLTKTIFDRIAKNPSTNEIRKECLDIFLNLYIWRNHPLSCEIVYKIISYPDVYFPEASRVLLSLRDMITYVLTDLPDSYVDEVRKRVLELFKDLLRSSKSDLNKLNTHYAGVSFDEWPQTDQEKATLLMRLIDTAGKEIYFATEEYNTKRQSQAQTVRESSSALEQFYYEVGEVLDELAEVAHPSVTYNLLKTLEYFIPVDPRGVFLRIHRVVSFGQQGGYQYESIAADLIVRLIERYLAEYRTVLQRDSDCRNALIEIMDVFVKVGWPSSRNLTYRLEEIFR